jgi:hypothetical protein
MLLVGLALECVSESRTVPPRSVGGARNSFHARSTIERGGIATNKEISKRFNVAYGML